MGFTDLHVHTHCYEFVNCSLFFIISIRAASSLPAEEKFSEEMRVELSKLLDPVQAGKDVFALANRLGYDNLISALEVMGCSGSSPTNFLLDYHEVIISCMELAGCSIGFLCGCGVDTGFVVLYLTLLLISTLPPPHPLLLVSTLPHPLLLISTRPPHPPPKR